ncbi:MAG: MoaD/ThiS family protein [Gammaproteobacteria bacterium]|nr:MoaD/ThiS family protein [Gammaproteobacteria bacterium]
MRLEFKLYASLGEYLPPGTNGHVLKVDVPAGTSPLDLLERYGVPLAQVHLVLVNGVFIPPDQRTLPLKEGDELAVWPAVAGG